MRTDGPLFSIVVAGRNDNYGGDFRDRLFRCTEHNCALLQSAGVRFEYLLAEWNPLPDRTSLSEEFVTRVPNSRAIVIPPEIHEKYSLNAEMPFHEMAAKNAALRRAAGEYAVVTNADILFGEPLVKRMATGSFAPRTLYRAHRVDVSPELTWDAMRDPRNQLPSGEGKAMPVPYLGAGGDFCLGALDLWRFLGGFNERIRFSTRAKDWQFFLCALARGVEVEFIGDVYHLDHEGGFRNTPAGEMNAPGVHFGRWWDIEFGLPVANSPDWGFERLPGLFSSDGSRIATLDARGYRVPEEQERRDQEMMTWLTRPAGRADTDTAFLLHAICAAHREQRRLIFRIQEAPLAAALAGFELVARRFGVPCYADWIWPATPGYSVQPFQWAPNALDLEDWIVERVDDRLCVREAGSLREVEVLPRVVPVNGPEFNPVLSRRLLSAYLRFQESGTRRLTIYGAGGHTQAVLRWGLPDSVEFAGIIDSQSAPAVDPRSFDTVLLSSASFEPDMLETCRQYALPNPVALYGDWPVDCVNDEAFAERIA